MGHVQQHRLLVLRALVETLTERERSRQVDFTMQLDDNSFSKFYDRTLQHVATPAHLRTQAKAPLKAPNPGMATTTPEDLVLLFGT